MRQAETEKQYTDLVRQLNTDFSRAGIQAIFDETSSPWLLKTQLQETLSQLLHRQPDSLQQLLYLVDVPEHSLATVKIEEAPEQVAFLILRREWQKVCFRTKTG